MRTGARAALLAARMHLIPAAPIDIFRFLNVPAIVMTLKAVKGRVCSEVHEARVSPASAGRSRGTWSRRR